MAFKVGLKDLQKKLQSKKTKFVSGPNGLQAHQVKVIETHLRLIVTNGQKTQDSSERAAESHRFAPKWGGRQVCVWTHLWIKERVFPQSMTGHHAKVYSLLSNPEVAAEL